MGVALRGGVYPLFYGSVLMLILEDPVGLEKEVAHDNDI